MNLFTIFYSLLILVNIVFCDECGKQTSVHPLIFGGTSVSIGDFPWVVPLLLKSNDMFFCGSNLISNQHVLTAAHCIIEKEATRAFTKDDMYAYVGRYDIASTTYEEKSSKEDIKRIIVHPNWSPHNIRYDADIAILTLKNHIAFTDVVQPVCLPTEDAHIFNIRGTVVGYGKSESGALHENTPRKVEISSYTNEDCFFSDYRFAQFGSPRTFCAGERGKTPCQGDSGSGFYIKVKSSWTVLGLVSAATVQECGSNDYVLFTNVAKYSDWIQNEITNSDENDALETAFNSFDENEAKGLNVVDAQCKYLGDTPYACYVNGLTAPDEDIKLRIRTGQHKSQRTNRDVTAMQLLRGSVTHFPDLSDAVTTFPNLNGFGITFTKLKHIDRSKLKDLGRLKFLLISDNEIEDIPPDTFEDLRNLELIDICRNQMKKLIPNWISSMPKLRVFKARSNKFQYVPQDMFKNNPELEEILFDFNQLQRIDVNFLELKNLKNLRMLENSCIDMMYCKDNNNQKCIKSLQQISLLVKGYCGNFTQ